MSALKAASAGALALVVLAGVGAVVLYRLPEQPFQGYTAPEQFVELANGSSPRAIGEKLVGAGVVRDRLTFRLALWRLGVSRRLKAGEYRFAGPANALEVASRIARGDVFVQPVTFPEGLTIEDMARLYEEHGLGAAPAFRRAAADLALVGDLDPKARDLEGYLFPDTYALPRRAGASDLVRMMVRRFRQAFTPLAAGAATSGLSVREVVTLASMVEKETGRPDERPVVAGVYMNRLALHMELQCDPTVIYGLRKAGRYDGDLTRDNLGWDTPYNTYVHAGLPPGPIASPGRASLEAAVRPARVDFLYFVSRNDGSHEFSRTLDEHNRKVQRYQREDFRKRRGGVGASPRISGRRGGRGFINGPLRKATLAGCHRLLLSHTGYVAFGYGIGIGDPGGAGRCAPFGEVGVLLTETNAPPAIPSASWSVSSSDCEPGAAAGTSPTPIASFSSDIG